MSVKKGRWLASFVFMLGAAFIGGFFWWQWATGPVGGRESVVFVIKKGESLGSIAQRLKKEDLVRSPFAFRLWVLANDITRKIQAGDFRLSQEMSLGKVAAQLTHGTLDVWVTLLEGWRSEEMAKELIEKGFNIDTRNWELEIRNSQLEGYLFPDTYLIPKGASQEKILEMLQNNFDKKVSDSLKNLITRKGLTLKQAVILASIVEREVRTGKDRPIVAGILVKRWQNDWPLQADATVQYAVADVRCQTSDVRCDWWPQNLTKRDLEIDSPYNTYKYKGLPLGPICSPSLASIEAVASYQETPYWFYLADLQGVTHYAKTIEEHNANIARYLGK